MTIQKKQKFLTIEKQVYSFAIWGMTKKVFRFYKNFLLPPTIDYTIDPRNCEPLEMPEKTLWMVKKEIPEEMKILFSENIKIQEKILEMVRKRNEEFHYRCWLIRLTTGKGKSHVVIDITNYYQVNTIILVHNVKTLWEMCKKIEEFTNIKPSVYWWWKKELWKITIMTKKSFVLDHRKIEQDFWLVLIDEAPIQFSKKFWEALNFFFHWKKWIALYWLSGTPYKNELDQEEIEKYFWLTIEVKWQKNNWYNIVPHFKMLDYYHEWPRLEYESPAEMRTALAEDWVRLSRQVQEIENFMDKRNCLLVLTDRVSETENFEEGIIEKWLPCDFLFCMTWKTKEKDDDANIKKAEEIIERWGQVIIIGTIQKVWVWVDIPFIDTILLASAIKFKATVVQAIGRWLRKHKTKQDVIVWVWNDLPILRGQRNEKTRAIETEYQIKVTDYERI